MALPIHKITVVNSSGLNNKGYGIFSGKPAVKGSGFISATQVVWHKLEPVHNNQQDSFEYSSSFYAFVGSSGAQSLTLETDKTSISLRDKYVIAALAKDNGRGTDVKVEQSLVLSADTQANGLPEASFTMAVASLAPQQPNFYVIGVARDLVRNHSVARVQPIAAVQLKRATKVTFTPSKTVIIAVTDLHVGDTKTDQFDSDAMAVVEFPGDIREAVVTEKDDGSFKVEYLP
ncbi:hypothetical protein B0H63DRAFT_487372 [Podospora didyma]|uniref:Uncharacterized protein n=1 Tax=Podospora didyma TaxID=330526 RepID=A0AAE0K795_9PEZI|nr:hypothetical protein B0H63DRAFT_487372 [Podospora didyma]